MDKPQSADTPQTNGQSRDIVAELREFELEMLEFENDRDSADLVCVSRSSFRRWRKTLKGMTDAVERDYVRRPSPERLNQAWVHYATGDPYGHAYLPEDRVDGFVEFLLSKEKG